MNANATRAIALSLSALSGMVAGSAGTYAISHGAHESIVGAVGDTLTFLTSVQTDSILRVIGPGKAIMQACGNSFAYLRLNRNSDVDHLTADSIGVAVQNNCRPVTAPSTLTVCLFPNPDSTVKYQSVLDSNQAAHHDSAMSLPPNVNIPCDSASGSLSPNTAKPSIMFLKPPS